MTRLSPLPIVRAQTPEELVIQQLERRIIALTNRIVKLSVRRLPLKPPPAPKPLPRPKLPGDTLTKQEVSDLYRLLRLHLLSLEAKTCALDRLGRTAEALEALSQAQYWSRLRDKLASVIPAHVQPRRMADPAYAKRRLAFHKVQRGCKTRQVVEHEPGRFKGFCPGKQRLCHVNICPLMEASND